MLTSIDQWWQLHHTNPFDPATQAAVQETVPSVIDDSLAEQDAFNKANR
jgi:1,6-anhydro-N-acetylmuramate kinase